VLNRVNGQIHGPFALPHGKKPPISIEYESGWAPAMVAPVGKEINLFPLSGIEPRFVVCVGRTVVIITTELSEPLI
jgi:hypothetical protein